MNPTPNILVVFYSLTGATREIAAEIARRCDADMKRIRDIGSIRGWWGRLGLAMDALRNTPASIRHGANRRTYDIVIIGVPVRAGHIATPVRAYLAEHAGAFKHVAFFCTLGGRHAERVFDELAALAGQAPIAKLALTAEVIARRLYDVPLNAFVKSITERNGNEAPANEPQRVASVI